VATQLKDWVSDPSFAGIEGSNPAWAMGVCVFLVMCVECRGVCVELITPPEGLYRAYCV
jgi:hypothetical protein